jgi:hypothetical protein
VQTFVVCQRRSTVESGLIRIGRSAWRASKARVSSSPREWVQFATGDKASCTQAVSAIPGPESYVELLTCLEMARDARKLPKE